MVKYIHIFIININFLFIRKEVVVLESIKNSVSFFRDTDFKDESPLKTVERIKKILHNYKIETTEKWNESSVPYCFSLRVSVVGTTFGTNGKGITKEFALASAYGELMERLQLGAIGGDNVQKDGNSSINDAQSVFVTAKDLLSNNYKWYEALSIGLERIIGHKESPENILMQYANEDGNLLATPYYCINNKRREYIPTSLNKALYGTNGYAAGNTMEEAIVQAMSEIVERNHQTYMFYNNVTAPNIPEDVIEKCEVAYKIISFLRNNGFKVVIKDCSLSTKFPVVSVCIINTNTGKYHIHLGAYPIFEIALERALTESFQGRSIDKLATFEEFRYDDLSSLNLNILYNGLIKGVSEKSPRFFVGENTFEYNDKMGFSGKNNKELLNEYVDYFKAKGLDVLVRDISCFDFPTYQVLIPGYSEVLTHRLSKKHDDQAYKKYARKVLRNPSKATFEEMLGFLMNMAEISKVSVFRSSNIFASDTGLSLNISKQEDAYMLSASLAYVNYSLSRFSETIKYINKMLEINNAKEEYLICIKRYLSLTINQYNDLDIKELLQLFHNKETVDKLYKYIKANENPLEEFVLHCSNVCSESCILYKSCCQRRVREIAAIINEKTKQLNFDEFVRKLEQILAS